VSKRGPHGTAAQQVRDRDVDLAPAAAMRMHTTSLGVPGADGAREREPRSGSLK
jgi:hypothetical protein